MKVAILSDGIPGHVNQSIGIINLLSEEKKTYNKFGDFCV